RHGHHRGVERSLHHPRCRAGVLVALVLDGDGIQAVGEQAARGSRGGWVHAGICRKNTLPGQRRGGQVSRVRLLEMSMLRTSASPSVLANMTRLSFIALALLAIPVARSDAQQPPSQGRSAYEELQTFSGVLNHIRVNYVDSVTYAQLVRAAIDGVLHSLDPHSRFESYAEHDKAGKLARGELAVTGVVLEDVDG